MSTITVNYYPYGIPKTEPDSKQYYYGIAENQNRPFCPKLNITLNPYQIYLRTPKNSWDFGFPLENLLNS